MLPAYAGSVKDLVGSIFVCGPLHHYVQLFSISGAVGLFRSDMLLIFYMVWPRFSCGTVFISLQFPHRGNDTIFWIFPIAPCHAFCMWHWPIGKDLDLSFIWGHHHLHIVGLWISVDQLNTSQLATSCWRDPTRSKHLSTVAIGFQFGLSRVVAPLSFPRSISLASLFTREERAWGRGWIYLFRRLRN